MLSKEEQTRLGASLLGISYVDAQKYSIEIGDGDAIYLSIPTKGGGSLIVGADGQALYAVSAVGFDKHLEEYNKGRRTPLESFKKYTEEITNS